jgi:hypothetical protein
MALRENLTKHTICGGYRISGLRKRQSDLAAGAGRIGSRRRGGKIDGMFRIADTEVCLGVCPPACIEPVLLAV